MLKTKTVRNSNIWSFNILKFGILNNFESELAVLSTHIEKSADFIK